MLEEKIILNILKNVLLIKKSYYLMVYILGIMMLLAVIRGLILVKFIWILDFTVSLNNKLLYFKVLNLICIRINVMIILKIRLDNINTYFK
jgi:hypothetical protein